jgi:hypothetical protein
VHRIGGERSDNYRSSNLVATRSAGTATAQGFRVCNESVSKEFLELRHSRADCALRVPFHEEIHLGQLADTRYLALVGLVVLTFGGDGHTGVIENFGDICTIGDGPLYPHVSNLF